MPAFLLLHPQKPPAKQMDLLLNNVCIFIPASSAGFFYFWNGKGENELFPQVFDVSDWLRLKHIISFHHNKH